MRRLELLAMLILATLQASLATESQRVDKLNFFTLPTLAPRVRAKSSGSSSSSSTTLAWRTSTTAAESSSEESEACERVLLNRDKYSLVTVNGRVVSSAEPIYACRLSEEEDDGDLKCLATYKKVAGLLHGAEWIKLVRNIPSAVRCTAVYAI